MNRKEWEELYGITEEPDMTEEADQEDTEEVEEAEHNGRSV